MDMWKFSGLKSHALISVEKWEVVLYHLLYMWVMLHEKALQV